MKELKLALRSKRRLIRQGVLAYSRKHGRPFAWRAENRTPYQVLIAEVLLRRTTASAVARLYDNFLSQFPSVTELFRANEEIIRCVLTVVGLQRDRARLLKVMAAHLMTLHNGNIPTEIDELRRVPGVGSYTARAVRAFAFNQRVGIVDSNVERVLRRVFNRCLSARGDLKELEDAVDTLVPANHRAFNFGLLDLGSALCRGSNPRCEVCPLRRCCDYASKCGMPPG